MMVTKGKWHKFMSMIYDKNRRVIVEVADGSFNEKEANANLIVSAVNSCKEINPDNPQAVAEGIKDMYEALKHLIGITASLKPNGNIPQADIDSVLLDGKKALAKAEKR